jgi:hypothetical protein
VALLHSRSLVNERFYLYLGGRARVVLALALVLLC